MCEDCRRPCITCGGGGATVRYDSGNRCVGCAVIWEHAELMLARATTREFAPVA